MIEYKEYIGDIESDDQARIFHGEVQKAIEDELRAAKS